MKQLIVMISMIVLGIAIGGFVMGFKGVAEDVSKAAASMITLANITEPADFD
jgi:hypothetical protein